MKDHFHLNTTPSGEDCAQVGDDNYYSDARLEARIYVDQLLRTFGTNPPGTRFKLVKCLHDFGPYYDIQFHFDDEDQRQVAFAMKVESGVEFWDKKSLKELRDGGYKVKLKSKKKEVKEKDASYPYDKDDDSFYTTDNGPTGHGDVCYSDADPGL